MTLPSATDLERLRARLAELARVVAPTVVAADSYGLIAHVDPPLARALGWQSEELLGQPLTIIIPRRFRDAHHLGFSRFLAGGRQTILERPIQLWIVTRTGEERRVEHLITAIRGEHGWLFGAAIRTEAIDVP